MTPTLFKRLHLKYNIKGIYMISDNNNPMKGTTMIITLYNPRFVPSLNRPKVSNDNPFIESLFKALKYKGYSGQLKDSEHARIRMEDFVDWHNTERRHSAIGCVPTRQQRDILKTY